MGEAKRKAGRVIQATADHEACFQAICAAMAPYADKIGAEGLLALTARLVGYTIAAQDQRTMTTDRALLIVQTNIEDGNRFFIENGVGAPSQGAA